MNIPVLACLLAVAAAAFVAVAVERVGAIGRPATELFAAEHGVAPTPEGLELCRRYLSRARQFRFIGSFAGLLLGIVLTQTVGINLITIVPGWFVGVIAAELFRLRARNRSSAQRTASLELRTASRYVPRRLAWHSRALAAATVAVAIAGLVMPWPSEHTALLAWSISSVAIFGIAELSQRAIAARTRPALPPAIEQADDTIRRVGAMAVGYAASATLAVLFGLVCIAGRGSGTAPANLSGTMTVVGLGAILWGIALAVVEHRFFWPTVRAAGRARPAANS